MHPPVKKACGATMQLVVTENGKKSLVAIGPCLGKNEHAVHMARKRMDDPITNNLVIIMIKWTSEAVATGLLPTCKCGKSQVEAKITLGTSHGKFVLACNDTNCTEFQDVLKALRVEKKGNSPPPKCDSCNRQKWITVVSGPGEPIKKDWACSNERDTANYRPYR